MKFVTLVHSAKAAVGRYSKIGTLDPSLSIEYREYDLWSGSSLLSKIGPFVLVVGKIGPLVLVVNKIEPLVHSGHTLKSKPFMEIHIAKVNFLKRIGK